MSPDLQQRLRRGFVAFAIFVVAMLLLSSRPFLVVPAGHNAVVFNIFTGVEERVRGEGFTLLLPLVQYPQLYDIRTATYTMSATSEDRINVDPNPLVALTKDGQPVTVDVTVLYHPDPQKLPVLYREIGLERDYREKIIRPEIRTLVRMAVAQYAVTDVYSEKRENLQEELVARVRAAFGKCYLVLEDIKLRNVTFSPQFQEAIEKKQVAEQQVQRMTYILQQAEKAVVEAEGQADAIQAVAESLTRNPQLLDYEFVQNLNPKAKTVIVSSPAIVSLGNILGE